jgi:polysaccharide export outer membrane protein
MSIQNMLSRRTIHRSPYKRFSASWGTALMFVVLWAAIALGAGQNHVQNSPVQNRSSEQLIAQNAGSERLPFDQSQTKRSLTLPSSNTQAAAANIDPTAYTIGEQDTLMITVWKEKELSGSVVVRPDGKVTVPLVGEVTIVGMTPLQVQALLTDKLKPYVEIPQVSVAVTDIRSRKVYLIGHVGREGSFTINSTTTVLQIIAQAGGLKDFAKRKRIYILRQNGNESLHLPFNYDDVIRGKNTDQNILLQPGDTIVVP